MSSLPGSVALCLVFTIQDLSCPFISFTGWNLPTVHFLEVLIVMSLSWNIGSARIKDLWISIQRVKLSLWNWSLESIRLTVFRADSDSRRCDPSGDDEWRDSRVLFLISFGETSKDPFICQAGRIDPTQRPDNKTLSTFPSHSPASGLHGCEM